MEFDVGRLRRGERIAAIGGILLFILLFFDWYDVSINAGVANVSGGISAWDAFDLLDIYLLVVALVAVGLALLTATQRTPALPVTASVIVTALGAIAALLILFRIVDTPGGTPPPGVDISATFWAFAGLVSAAGIAYGGYLSMRDEGTTLGDAGARARSAFQAGGSPPPPSPPPAASEPPAEPAGAPSGPPPSAPPPGAA
jgi:hypothetical protein